MKSSTPKKPSPSHHAVEVKPGFKCCSAAAEIIGRRHLSREKPPKLPLPECTQMDTCDCRYLHHPDRRASSRRRGWATIATKLGDELMKQVKPGKNVRSTRGRRKSD